MHSVYILYSPQLAKFYVGESEDVDQRLYWHNTHTFHRASTKTATDWQIRKTMTVATRSDARKVEGYIKSMKSSKFLERLVDDARFYENFLIIVRDKFGIEIR